MNRKNISSDRSISSHKPEAKEYFVAVKNYPKLFLLVKPSGQKAWIYRYTKPTTKNRAKVFIGNYPTISLVKACEYWRKAEQLLAENIDPQQERETIRNKEQDSQMNTFEYFAELYFESIKINQKLNTLVRKKGRINLLCHYLGHEAIDNITAPRMLQVLEDIQANSLNKDGRPTDKAERCAGIASEIFAYAGARGFCSSNPANLVKGQLASYSYGHRPAVTKPQDLAMLLKRIETLEVEPNTITALRLLPLLFVRNGDLRRAKWTDIDLENRRWYLNPLKGEGKEKMVREMVVPLPKQAVEILKQHQKLTGHRDYVFHSERATKNQIMSENTANDSLKELGYKNIHCVHGFRATAKTILQEQLKYPLVLVEMALGHVSKDPNGTAYGRFEFLDDRAEMMQNWADYLDALYQGHDASIYRCSTINNPTTQLEQLMRSLGKDKVLEILEINKF